MNDQRSIRTYRILLYVLVAFAAISIVFYLIVYTQTHLYQALVAASFVAIAIPFAPIAYQAMKRNWRTLPGIMVVVAVMIAYGGNELAWKGLTLYHIIGGVFIVYLAGSIVLPRKQMLWLGAVVLYLMFILFVNNLPLNRYEAANAPVLIVYAMSLNIVLAFVVTIQFLVNLQSRTIRTRLAINVIAVMLVPIVIVIAVTGLQSAQNAQTQALGKLDMIADLKLDQIRTWQTSIRDALLALLPSLDQANEFDAVETVIREYGVVDSELVSSAQRTARASLKRIVTNNRYYSEVSILDLQGNVVLSTQLQKERTRESLLYASALQDSVQPAWVLASNSTGLDIYIVVPILTSNLERIGIYVAKTDSAPIIETISRRVGLGDTGETYLVSKNNKLLTPSRFPGYSLGRTIDTSGVKDVFRIQRGGSGFYAGYRELPVIGVYRYISEFDAALMAEQDQAEILAPTIQFMWINSAIIGVTLILGVIAALFITGQIVTPLARLSQTAEDVAAGNLNLTVSIDRDDEIGHLAKSFNTMTGRLHETMNNLEQRVTERTQAFERRSVQLQVAAEIAREATSVRNLDELLRRAVSLIRERFGFYHAGIFLIEESGEYAVLRAATGEAGRQMIEQGHKLKVGETGIVGYVTDMGTARVALNVDSDPTHFKNPLLPATRSEIALPLKVSEKIIGALDVQSTQPAAFDQDSINILQTMADQLGVAIDNARMFRDMERTLSELEAAQGRLTQEAWRSLHERTGKILGYRYRGMAVETAVTRNPEAQEALSQGKTIFNGAAGPDVPAALAIPMKIRNQVIGVLNIRFTGQTPSNEAILTFEEIANRLALVLENLRLLEEAQHIATREQQVNIIATEIRRSANIEAILQNTVHELGKALGASRTFVQLGVDLNPQKEEML